MPYCPACGHPSETSHTFCYQCGKKLPTAPPAASLKPEPVAPTPEPEPTPNPPEPEISTEPEPKPEPEPSLSPKQREREVAHALMRLAKLGRASVGRNDRAVEHIDKQILEIGERLMELGGTGLTDRVYDKLEKIESRIVVRAVTLAWRRGLKGWFM